MFKGFNYFLCVLVVVIGGCSDHELPRVYQEFSEQPEAVLQPCVKPSDSHDHSHEHSYAPDDHKTAGQVSTTQISDEKLKAHIDHVWSEQIPAWLAAPPATMSLATFKPSDNNTTTQVTFTVLSGEGGGIKGNVTRWIGQLNHLTITEAQAAAFISKLEAEANSDGHSFTPVDFTSFGVADTELSLLAAVIPLNDRTLFVKLSGPLSELKNLRDVFFNKVSATAEIESYDENQ